MRRFRKSHNKGYKKGYNHHRSHSKRHKTKRLRNYPLVQRGGIRL